MEECRHCQAKVSEGSVFCTECGQSLKEKQAQTTFCTNCGEKIIGSSTYCVNCGVAQSKDEKVPSVVKPKKAMSKGKKVLIGVSVLTALLIFGAYKYLENYYNPLNQLVKMDEAIINDDVEGFMNYIDVKDEGVFDKDVYFKYIKDEEWNNGLSEAYEALILSEKEHPTTLQQELYSRYDAPLFKVQNDKKLLGIFNTYRLVAVPVEVAMKTNLPQTKIVISDQEYTLEDVNEQPTIESFYPGIYAVEAITQTDYGEFTVEEEYEISASEVEDLHITFDYNEYALNIDPEFSDATLFVNGENTKKKVSDVNAIGPVPKGSEVNVHAVWKDAKDKKHRSTTLQLNEEQSDYVYLEFDERINLDADENDDEDYQLAEFLLEFREAYEYAVNYSDYDEIHHFMKKGSDEEKDLKKFIKDMGAANYYYEFGDNTVTNVDKKDDHNFQVKTNETFTFYDEDGLIYDYDRDKVYFIELIDGEYKIHKIDYKDTKKKRIN